jgi:transcriptional regulator with XRE-family HTH domain
MMGRLWAISRSEATPYMPLHGDRLRKLRHTRQFTQEELAERLNLGIRQIHRYENGLSDPAGDIVARIARELGVTTDYLLGLVEEPTQYSRAVGLSAVEQRLVEAFRRQDLATVLQIIAAEVRQQTIIIPGDGLKIGTDGGRVDSATRPKKSRKPRKLDGEA